MKILLVMILWAILLVICWPVAILALLLWLVIWLLAIPFRIVRIFMEAFLALVKRVLFLPARLLGYRKNA